MKILKRLVVIALTASVAGAAGYIVRDTSEEEAYGPEAVLATMHSKVLNEERDYVVYLPDDYEVETTRRYPVLYVLDGQSQSGPAAEAVGLMSRIGVIQPVIVVGVPEDGKTRSRDYTPPDMLTEIEDPASPRGSGDRFLDFLRDELIPVTERDYRTARPRMLSGWSRSGLFVVYSEIADPTLFDARFAHSPALWRESNAIVVRLAESFKTPPTPSGFLFLSLGNKENETMTAAFDFASTLLREQAPPTLRLQTYRSGGTHETNPKLSFPIGICAQLCAPNSQAGKLELSRADP